MTAYVYYFVDNFNYCQLLILQPSYLHTDFNKWKDEDDSEGEDLGMDDNFEAVSITEDYQKYCYVPNNVIVADVLFLYAELQISLLRINLNDCFHR